MYRLFYSTIFNQLPGLSVTILMLVMMTSNAMAAGTASGTSVSNSATVNYEVGSVEQLTISSTVTFVIDTKIDLTVTTDDIAAVAVTPGSNDNVMTFTVTNTGNASQDFMLSSVALASGAGAFTGNADNIDADNVQIFVETAGGAGYQLASDTNTHINSLAADASIKVYIVSDFNTDYADGDIASYHLLAEARIEDVSSTLGGALTETAGADTDASVDIVFSDGVGSNDASVDARYSSQDDYEISTATLTIGKSSSVVSDPVNGTGIDRKRIPGAIIEYEITISNNGSATASNIAMTDSLNEEIAEGDIIFNTQYEATAGNGFSIAHPDYSSGAYAEYTNASGLESPIKGGVEADWSVTTTNVVTVTNIKLDAGESAVIRFRVTIQ